MKLFRSIEVAASAPVLALSFALIACGSDTPPPAPIQTSLEGRVTDDRNAAVTGAQIITIPTTSTVASVDDGKWTILNVPPGPYEVIATKNGYEQSRVQVVAIEGQKTPVSLQLKTPPAIARVRIEPRSATVEVSKALQLSAELTDSKGAVLTNRTVTWLSLNPVTASVSSNGMVTALSVGTARIEASAEGIRDTATIASIAQIPVASVVIVSGPAALDSGVSAYLRAEPRDAANRPLAGKTITWTTSDASIVSLGSAQGDSVLAVAVTPGRSTIQARSEGKDAALPIDVKRIPQVARVTLTPATLSLSRGTTSSLVRQAFDAAGAAIAVSIALRSTAPSIATVDTSGEVTAVADGSALIIASAGQVADTTAVTVATQLEAASITITPSLLTIDEGASSLLTATVKDAGGNVLTGRTIAWSSSHPAIASVSAQGVVSALVEGDTVTITAQTGQVSHTAKVAVRSPFFLARDVSIGALHTCAVRMTGGAYCFGASALGSGTARADGTRNLVQGSEDFVSVIAGNAHACALNSVGQAFCWGSGPEGVLGDGTRGFRTIPTPVQSTVLFKRLARGQLSTCGLTDAGAAYCWGYNRFGMLGVGNADDAITVPTPVVGGERFTELTSGYSHVCGVNVNTLGMCWGLSVNGNGVLGDGSRSGKGSPTALSGNLKLRSISTWTYHACGVDVQGAAWCWGSNSLGVMGTGGGDTDVPARVASSVSYTAIATAQQHTCALAGSGEIYCWGRGLAGELGDGKGTNSLVPVKVASGATRFVALSAFYMQTCAIATDRKLFCWGSNSHGQLGLAAGGVSLVPVAVPRP